MAEKIKVKKVLCGEEVEVVYRDAKKPATTEVIELHGEGLHNLNMGFCPPLNPHTYYAEHDIICDQDVSMSLRDGTIIYCDIFRPVDQKNIPAIVSWSNFGKRQSEGSPEWQLMGVPPGTVSSMAKFESADPSYWCRHGYAIVNVDPRGCGHSGGDMNMLNTQEGLDGYDFIEWLATNHDWCNGKVGMFGNSQVAMTQMRIAAEQPPHLTAIAPWEGMTDLYREDIYEGGITALGMNDFIISSLVGSNYVEDTASNGLEHPFFNAYWQDKIPRFENVKIPTYVTACWNHLHLRGSFEFFRKIRSRKKWMRAHRDFEWPDTYSEFGIHELKRFFDRYLKEIHNGWELTPRVRIEVMDSYDFNFQENRPEKEFPLARTQYKKLYVDAKNKALSFEPVSKESKISYEGEKGFTTFDIKFNEDTEITGYMKLRLWVEAEGNDDMDLFVAIQKLDEEGTWLPVKVLGEPHPGAWGKMRASRRELDPDLSTDFQPVQAHKRDQKLSPGEIVPVDIEIRPHSRIWHKGEQLRILLSGHYIREGWFEPFSWETNNKGNHVIHSGGKYDSYLQIPVIPPKFRAGDYLYR